MSGVSNFYVTRRATWSEVQEAIRTRDFSRIGRLPEDVKVYNETNTKLQEVFATIDDFILHRVFRLSCQINSSGKKYVAPESLQRV